MNIGIDIRYLSHGIVGGVKNYVRYLTPAIVQQADARGFRTWLYADAKAPLELDRDALPTSCAVRVLPYRNALSSVWHDLFLGRAMARDGVTVAHFPANYGFGPARGATTFTLHDRLTIQPLRQVLAGTGSRRTLRSLVMTLYLHLFSTATLRRARVMFAVSDYARADILNFCAYPAERVISAPYGAPPHMRCVDDSASLADVRARLALPSRFVLADALKNPAVISRAWARLPEALRASHKVVFFSRRPDPLPVVQQMVDAGIAQVLFRPSDEDMVALYNLADAFVFPSWIEGFGIPLLEAMTCGAPVIASDRGSIPEIAGDAALYIDAEDDTALAAHLSRALSDARAADDLRQRGFARAKLYSWDAAARRVLDGYALASAR
jgi:glycosyltransferase involved in cell wall biosynthesis